MSLSATGSLCTRPGFLTDDNPQKLQLSNLKQDAFAGVYIDLSCRGCRFLAIHLNPALFDQPLRFFLRSSETSIDDALAIVRPREQVVLVGMAGRVTVDMTALWHKEVRLVGAYTYGEESTGERTFDMAFDLVRDADLACLVPS